MSQANRQGQRCFPVSVNESKQPVRQKDSAFTNFGFELVFPDVPEHKTTVRRKKY
jgi:hypothetical protein